MSAPAPGQHQGAPSPAAPDAPWFRRLTFFGLLSSLTPLIPLPFVDDWAAAWVERRLVVDTFRRRGLAAQAWHVGVLTWGGEEGRRGCLYPLLLGFRLVVYLAKKIFRKLLVFLLIKDCVDHFSTTFQHGYLLHVAFERGLLDERTLAGGERLIEVRQAMLATCEAIDPRPLNQVLRRVLSGSRRLLLEAARGFGRLLRAERREQRAAGNAGAEAAAAVPGSEARIEAQEEAVGGLLDRLTGVLWANQAYRAELERAFLRESTL